MKQEISFEIPFRIASLAKKHFAVSLTEEEQTELDAWIYSNPHLWAEIEDAAAKEWQNDPLQHYDVAAATIAIHQKIRKNKQKRIYRLVAAAAILILSIPEIPLRTSSLRGHEYRQRCATWFYPGTVGNG
jgi:hypothetical protein